MPEIEWLRILLTYGPLGVFAVASLYGIWKASHWLAANILKPAFDEHMKLLMSIRTANDRNTTAIESIDESFRRIVAKISEGVKAQEKTAEVMVEAAKKGNGH